MGFSKIYRSIARLFSIKDIKITDQESCKSPKKLTKSQEPTNDNKTTLNKVMNFVGFLNSSRSKRYSTNDAVSSNISDGFTGPSFTDTVLPILMAITTASSTPPVNVIFDNNFDNDGEHASSVHMNEAVDIEGESLTLSASFRKLIAEIEPSQADHTIYYASVTQWTERLTFETLVSSELVLGVTEPIGSNVPLPVSTSDSFAKTSEEVEISNELSKANRVSSVDPVVQDESSSLSPENIADAVEQFHPLREHIDGCHFDETTGPSAAVTTVPFVPLSNPGVIIKAPLVQPLIEDEDPESFYRQVYVRCDSATGRLDPPDSYSPVGQQASFSQYDTDLEPMLNNSENLLEINDSDDRHYVLPQPDEVELDEEPMGLSRAHYSGG
ncbi:predicted protein [Sclerotinia sclerotiorum 1980 UF-70]|uniref:Uncharacterized protein n=1 Tax=Sclerotinia sclerotiorum (strain ATCC 18683 / 1980 / Ss-1) TaxID=665079 RepID=A7F9V9_SCLS1|nr:predicted protein [Sclerotinia sclerotiorum 1980 UF-70]EDO00520.1 predicted protein [Sclerotinia sclerotiorum 1980 UF-70]